MGMGWVGYRRDQEFIQAALRDPDVLMDLLDDEDEDNSTDLDKAWHGIHWLLTGSAEPDAGVGSQVIFGGEPLGEEVGYSPFHLILPADVARVAAFLEGVDADTLRSRMDPAAMSAADLYPDIWDQEYLFDQYVLPYYEDLRAFYRAAAAAGQGVFHAIV